MSKRLELCLIFFVGCTLNSSPIRDEAKSSGRTANGGSSTGSVSNSVEREDAAALDAESDSDRDPIATGNAGSDADDPSATADASTSDAAGAPAKAPTKPPKDPPKKPADAGPGSGGGSGGPSAAGAGSGGADATDTAGTGGAASDAGPDDGGLRDTLVDQVIDAFQDSGEGTVEIYMLLNDLRRMAATGEDLSAPFVLSLLDAMKKSGICLSDRERCQQICGTIGQDCKQCAADAMCKAALRDTCGPVVAGCYFSPGN